MIETWGTGCRGSAVLITVMVLKPIPSANEAVARLAWPVVRAQGADPAGAGSPDPDAANP